MFNAQWVVERRPPSFILPPRTGRQRRATTVVVGAAATMTRRRRCRGGGTTTTRQGSVTGDGGSCAPYSAIRSAAAPPDNPPLPPPSLPPPPTRHGGAVVGVGRHRRGGRGRGGLLTGASILSAFLDLSASPRCCRVVRGGVHGNRPNLVVGTDAARTERAEGERVFHSDRARSKVRLGDAQDQCHESRGDP